MSSENVEIVGRALEHFTRTGQPYREIMDDGTEIFDHDIPDARNPYRGRKGVDDWLSDFGAARDRYEMHMSA